MADPLLLATSNRDKLREIRAILAGTAIDTIGLDEIAPVPPPEESGDTFEANARAKALYYAARTGLVTVADDSGLVIDALGGAPGVQSARFLRPDASYPERFEEIYRRLAAQPGASRQARFVCAVCLVESARVLFEATAAVEGEIASAPRGSEGFGYDPIFFYPPYGGTLAEVSLAQKAAVDHRGQAFRALAAWLLAHRMHTR